MQDWHWDLHGGQSSSYNNFPGGAELQIIKSNLWLRVEPIVCTNQLDMYSTASTQQISALFPRQPLMPRHQKKSAYLQKIAVSEAQSMNSLSSNLAFILQSIFEPQFEVCDTFIYQLREFL